MRLEKVLVFAATLLFAVALFASVSDPKLHADELFHYDVVYGIIHHEAQPNWDLPMFPAYHYLLAIPGLLRQQAGAVPCIRFFSFCLSALSIFAFYRCAKSKNASDSIIRTLQYCFLPFAFPLFFLIYTDLFSLAFVVASLCLTIRRHYTLAGIAAAGAIATRQLNVVWLALCCILVLHDEKNIRIALKKGWMFVLLCAAFAVFVIVNRGVAIGNREEHPIGLYAGNIFFLLVLFFAFFLPWNLQNGRRIFSLLKSNKNAWLLIPGLYLLYVFTFSANHPYNRPLYSFWLRNQLLLLMNSSIVWKTLFFVPILYSVFSLIETKFEDRRSYYIYPATIFFLLPLWLIEQRYYLIPFALFNLVRPATSKKVEYLAIGMNVLLSCFFFWGIVTNRFFL